MNDYMTCSQEDINSNNKDSFMMVLQGEGGWGVPLRDKKEAVLSLPQKIIQCQRQRNNTYKVLRQRDGHSQVTLQHEVKMDVVQQERTEEIQHLYISRGRGKWDS